VYTEFLSRAIEHLTPASGQISSDKAFTQTIQLNFSINRRQFEQVFRKIYETNQPFNLDFSTSGPVDGLRVSATIVTTTADSAIFLSTV
jgi:hypothetical protein